MNFILGYARYLLLAGLGLFGLGGYLLYQSSTGGGIPQESALTRVSGDMVQATKVTVTKKRRRGGESKSHYYEIDLKPKTGEALKIRLPSLVPEAAVQAMANADVVDVGYDATSSDLNAYSVSGDGKEILPYAQMAKFMQDDADRSSAEAPMMMGGGFLLALLGGLGMWWRKKRIAEADMATA